MKVLTLILILSVPSLEAGLPKWFPASQGAVLEEAKERAEMDKKLAEMDETFVSMSASLKELKPHLAVLEHISRNNLELAGSNLDVANANIVEAEQASAVVGTIAKSVAFGDPMSIVAMLTTGLGLLGGAAGVQQRKKAQGFRAKALKYAHLDITASRAALKEDTDFPDVVA